MTPEDAQKFVESSFAPLRCVADLTDREKGLSFRVYDENGNALCQSDQLPVSLFTDRERLEFILDTRKSELRRKGYM